MEDGTGDGDKLERLRRVMEGIDPEEVARMLEPLPPRRNLDQPNPHATYEGIGTNQPQTPRAEADRADPNARFPWLGVILIAMAATVVVLVILAFVMAARNGDLPFGIFG